MMWKLLFTKRAKKDKKDLESATKSTKDNVHKFLEILKEDLYSSPYKILTGDLKGALSLRINDEDRLVYEILPEEKIVKVIRILGHYEN